MPMNCIVNKIETFRAVRPCNGVHEAGPQEGVFTILSNCPNEGVWDWFGAEPVESGECTPSPEHGRIMVATFWGFEEEEEDRREILFSATEEEDWSKYAGLNFGEARTVRMLDMLERDGFPVYLGKQMNWTSGVQGVFSNGVAHVGWETAFDLEVGEEYRPAGFYEAARFFDTMVHPEEDGKPVYHKRINGPHTQRMIKLLMEFGYTYNGEDYIPPNEEGDNNHYLNDYPLNH